MSKILLAVKKNTEGKSEQVYFGGLPWDGIHKIDVKDMFDKEIVFDNVRISDKLEVVCTIGDVRKYTTIVGDKTIKRSYVVLAKASRGAEDMYFVTDGLHEPIWIKASELRDRLFKDKADLANSSLDYENSVLNPTEKPFEEVDYTQLQLEYRKYLKGTK